jgi:hypothetical protein
MKKTCTALSLAVAALALMPDLASATNNAGDFGTGNGGIAVGAGYANTYNAPTNGIIAQGAVGIETTTPAVPLDVNGATDLRGVVYVGSPQTFAIGDDGGTLGGFVNETANLPLRFYTDGAERMRIAAGGNVGVGLTNPLAPLEVAGPICVGASGSSCTYNSYANELVTSNTSQTNLLLETQGAMTAGLGANSNGIYLGAQTGGNIYLTYGTAYYGNFAGGGSTALFVNGSNGNVGINTTTPAVQLDVDGTTDLRGVTWMGSPQTFAVGDDGGTLGGFVNETANLPLRFYTDGAERMRIAAGGNVGIGTTTPAVLLDVNGTTDLRGVTWMGSPQTFAVGDDGGTLGGFVNETANLPLRFFTDGAERMRIAAGGNVGIGTASPIVALDLSQKTDAVALPSGSTGQRPTGVNGEIRYNSTTSTLEAFANGVWTPLNGAGVTINSSGRLTGNGTSLSYCPYKGNLKTTALYGNYTIPSGCLTANLTNMRIGGNSSQSAATSTLYYVYLINVSGTTYLDLETSGHATDSSTGVEIMSGNNTRTLVGMIHTDGGADVASGQNTSVNTVATWDNRVPTATSCTYTQDRQIHNASPPVLINGENSCAFMSWGDSAHFASGQMAYAQYHVIITTYLCLDGTSSSISVTPVTSLLPTDGYGDQILAINPVNYTPTEGYHYTEITGFGTLNNYLTYMGGQTTSVLTVQ